MPSSYLRHLPPALLRQAPGVAAGTGADLGDFLQIFEKVLTGVDDGVPVAHGDHLHPSLSAAIGASADVLDPWRAPAAFLPWLAAWVGLDFPTLGDEQLWDERLRRNVTANFAGVLRSKGLKAGLAAHLDLLTAGLAEPRVAIDDGSRLFFTTPGPPGTQAPVAALVSQGPVIDEDAGTLLAEGLVRPWCAAVAGDGSIFVGDIGTPAGVQPIVPNRVWHLSALGEYELTGSPPRPLPVAAATLTLQSVSAVAVRPALGGAPETLYVLDQLGKLFSVPAPYRDRPAALVTNLATGNQFFSPIAMTVDPAGDLLVLDRGNGSGTANPPKIITVRPQPVNVTRTPLTTVLEPLALIALADGSLVIGDGREQDPATPAEFPANLVRVDRSNAAHWTETLMLPADNPLRAPTGIVPAGENTFHVLDLGLKPRFPADPYLVAAAQPAAVYHVDPGGPGATVRRVSETGQLVSPTGLVATGRTLVICDPGQLEAAPRPGTALARVRRHRFDVVVHFPVGNLPVDDQERTAVMARVLGTVRQVVAAHCPAHVLGVVVTGS